MFRSNIFLFFIVVVAFLPFKKGKSQSIDTLKISATFNNLPITSVLNQLEKTYHIRFYYNPDWLPAEKYITANFKNVALSQALESLLSTAQTSFVCIGENIVLMPQDEIEAILGSQSSDIVNTNDKYDFITIGDPKLLGKNRKVIIDGEITDGANGETLIGATIKVEGTNIYAVSGYTGNYQLTLDAGIYDISVSCMGYENKLIKVRAVSPGKLNIELFEKSHQINEVVVSSFRTENNVRGNQMSVVEMDAKSIKQLPLLVGEKDIIKGFTMMPGVKTVGEFGSGINVRGGGEDQNLYLLEGAPVFNTSHALGLMSVINPDAVNSVSLFKGHIPAEFGERVSSVMDIRVQDYNCKTFKLKGGVGIFSSRLQAEGPLFNEKITFKLGARTSYSDYLLKQMPDYYLSNSSISFYDVNGLVNFQLKNNPITLFGYFSNDFFRYANLFSYQYGNRLGSLSWSHLFNADLMSNVTLAYSKYAVLNKHFDDDLYARSVASNIQYLSGKFKISYAGFLNHRLTAGGQAINYSIEPGEQKPVKVNNAIIPATKHFVTQSEQAYDITFFLNDVYELNNKLSFQAGLRYGVYAYLGPRSVNNYVNGVTRSYLNVTDSTNYANGEVICTYKGFEPRLSAKYVIDDNSSVKLSYNQNRQNLTLLSHTSITTPEDVWKLADTYIKPVKVNQYAAGYYHNFAGNMFETSVEFYYKKLNHLTEFKNGADSMLNNHIETELIEATGSNYGVEFFVKKTMGQLTGSLTYTFSRALKQTHSKIRDEQINRNTEFPSVYDKPHDFNLMLNYNINRRLRFGANFGFTSGRPFTRPEYIYRANGQDIVYYSDRNKYRIPPYHRLDISFSIDENLKKAKRWKGSWTFSVLNVYARKNPYSIAYRRELPSAANNYEVFSLYKIYLIGKPFPTITYNFTF